MEGANESEANSLHDGIGLGKAVLVPQAPNPTNPRSAGGRFVQK